MYTTPGDYPMWTTKEGVFLPGEESLVKYRYCIFSGGKFKRWETDSGVLRDLKAHRSESTVMATADILGAIEQCSSDTAENETSVIGRIMTSSESRSIKTRQFLEWNKANKKRRGKKTITPSTSSASFTVDSASSVLVVSFFLPVIIHKSAEGVWSASWDHENLLALQTSAQSKSFIGCVRYHGNANSSSSGGIAAAASSQNGLSSEDERALTSVLAQMNCHPIFLGSALHHEFYDIYCKQVLWPTLHHVADVYGPIAQQSKQQRWEAYSKVNLIFKSKIVEVYPSNAIIWIHGFHLMLLPGFVRRVNPTAKIGFFFHTPFPSSEIWRTLVKRVDLLHGLLNADQVGFHLYEYARHFLTACRRLLGYGYGMNASGVVTLHANNQEIAITCLHVGVDVPNIHEAMKSDVFVKEYLHWRKKFGDKTVVASIDRMERLKGIPLKLKAIEQFLKEQKEKQKRAVTESGDGNTDAFETSNIVFALIGIPALERGDDYRQTLSDVTIMVNRINHMYGDPSAGYLPIYFVEKSEKNVKLTQRLAFFAAANVLMVCPPRDGLNRAPLEFIAARDAMKQYFANLASKGETPPIAVPKNTDSQIILSLFVSSTWVMRGSLIVNPWKIEEVVKALRRVLYTMPPSERENRYRNNVSYVSNMTALYWNNSILQALDSIEPAHTVTDRTTIGFGVKVKLMGMKAGFKPLDYNHITKHYRDSHHRLILLDWGGTLVNENADDNLKAYAVATGTAQRKGPTAELKELLKKLCSDIRNTVFVVSGKSLMSVADVFGNIEGLGVGAEHGFYYKLPSMLETNYRGIEVNIPSADGKPVKSKANAKKSKWHTMFAVEGEQTWKEVALMIMDIYTQRTHGAYIEKKEQALIWQYRDADPEFGYMQSKELEEHLIELLAGYRVVVLRGGATADGYVEVRPAGVSKGSFLEHALSILKSKHLRVDFILTVGDDNSDEPMFEQAIRLSDREKTGYGFVSPNASDSNLCTKNQTANSHSPSSTTNATSGLKDACAHPTVIENNMKVFTVSVGKKPNSAAESYVNDPSDVVELLQTLVKNSAFYGVGGGLNRKFHSTLNLSNASVVSGVTGGIAANCSNQSIGSSASGQAIDDAHITRNSSSNSSGIGIASSELKNNDLPTPTKDTERMPSTDGTPTFFVGSIPRAASVGGLTRIVGDVTLFNKPSAPLNMAPLVEESSEDDLGIDYKASGGNDYGQFGEPSSFEADFGINF